MQRETALAHDASSCTLPCVGCDAAIAAMSSDTGGHDIERSLIDGCWVVRIGFAEKLRSDSPCLACSYFRNKADLLAG